MSSAAPPWHVAALTRLRDPHTCPVCGRGPLGAPLCRFCGADLSSPAAHALWELSQQAASAMEAREAVRREVPRMPHAGVRTTIAGTGSMGPAAPAPSGRPLGSASTGPAPRRDTTLQSVLAAAGAGLFAVAAIVFTFFNPDLSDDGVRSVATLAATAVFVITARALSVRGLRSSAETAGALAVVFLGLDVYALAGFTPAGTSPWFLAGIGTLGAGMLAGLLSVRWRIRAWVGAATVALAVVPAMLGAAAPPPQGIAPITGWLTTMACAMAMIAVLQRRSAVTGVAYGPETVVLTLLQLFAAAAAVLHVAALQTGAAATLLWTASGVFSAIALISHLSSRRAAAALWSFATGGAMSATGGAVAQALVASLSGGEGWYPVGFVSGPVIGLLFVTLAIRRAARAHMEWALAGSLIVVAVCALPVLALAAFGTLLAVARAPQQVSLGVESFVGAAAALWIGSALFALHAAVSHRRGASVWAMVLAAWVAIVASIATVALPHGIPWLSTALGVGLATAGALLSTRLARGLSMARGPLLISAHLAVALAAWFSWATTSLAAAASPFVVAAVALLAAAWRRDRRWMHIGAAYSYALVGLAAALSLTGIGDIGIVSLTTAVAAGVAMTATYVRRVSARTWWAILAVTALPFALGIVQVALERSGWTALSTALIFLLALTLTATTRDGLGSALRAVCAAALVPSLSVVVICLGAQLLDVSASPVTLPVIAAVVALALSAVPIGSDALARRGIPRPSTVWAARAFEASALFTGVVAVGLSMAREAAGLGTALLVLLILAAGAGAAAASSRRGHLWWYAAATATGAVWVAWRMAGVDVVEPYTLPPALAAIAVGLFRELRAQDGRLLASAGLALALLPSLAALAVDGGSARFTGLLVVSGALCALARPLAPGARLARMRTPICVAAVIAAGAGPLQAARIGLGADVATSVPFWPALACGLAGAALAAAAGASIARTSDLTPRTSRWLLAPAATWLVAGTWTAIHRDWATIWGMWALMLTLLAAVAAIAWRRRTHDGILPPVWFMFALAFVTAVVAWSPRDLRVEWFSLPLGFALLAAGAFHLRSGALPSKGHSAREALDAWPRHARGSWRLLAPGVVVAMSASIVATFTDPLTWRAILVIVMALIAILVGARRRWAAPFVLGVIVLPIENVSAFSVQIGRGIDSMPWWITLAAVGAVLLILATSYERQAGAPAGFVARIRDLT